MFKRKKKNVRLKAIRITLTEEALELVDNIKINRPFRTRSETIEEIICIVDNLKSLPKSSKSWWVLLERLGKKKGSEIG